MRVGRKFWEENREGKRKEKKGKRKERKKEGKKRKKEGRKRKEKGRGMVAGHDRWSPAAVGGGRRRPESGSPSPSPNNHGGASVVKNEKSEFCKKDFGERSNMWRPDPGGYGNATATYIRRAMVPSCMYAKHQYNIGIRVQKMW